MQLAAQLPINYLGRALSRKNEVQQLDSFAQTHLVAKHTAGHGVGEVGWLSAHQSCPFRVVEPLSALALNLHQQRMQLARSPLRLLLTVLHPAGAHAL